MKRLVALCVLWAILSAARPVAAQFITPRQGGEVIGNSTKSVSVVQSAVRPAIEETELPGSTEASSEYVTVMGQVANPGVYEFRNGILGLAELIDQSGGLKSYSSREFYVYRAGIGFRELDFRTQADFRFENGDILIAETPVRYYRELDNSGTSISLYDIHPQTQIVLLNLADHPVLLSVAPNGARLSALLTQLNQGPEAMVGVQLIPPPHAREIPKHSQMAPSLIPSGSIVVFDSARINRDTLPNLPRPSFTPPRRDIQVVSRETPRTRSKSETLQQTGLYEWKKNVRETTLTELESPQSSAHETLGVPQRNPSEHRPSLLDQPDREKIVTETVIRPVLSKSTERHESREMILSPQQKAIVIGFVVVISLFAVAFLVRKNQEQRNLIPSAAATAGQAGAIVSFYTKFIRCFSGQTTEKSDEATLDAATEAAEAFADAATSVNELMSESPADEPSLANDSEEAVERFNVEVENRLAQFVNQIAALSNSINRLPVALPVETPANRQDQAATSPESLIESVDEHAPDSSEPASVERPSAAQPMFPMIWEQNLEQPGSSVPQPTAQTADANANPESPAISTPSGEHHPLANGPHRIPLDRVFFAVQRERQKDATRPSPDSNDAE